MKLFPLPQDELTRRDDIRTWNHEGQPVGGSLVVYDAGKVTIMDLAGKTTTLKLTELEPADREYVDQHAPTPAPRKSPVRATVPPNPK